MEDAGSLQTRVEAFLEMLRSGRRGTVARREARIPVAADESRRLSFPVMILGMAYRPACARSIALSAIALFLLAGWLANTCCADTFGTTSRGAQTLLACAMDAHAADDGRATGDAGSEDGLSACPCASCQSLPAVGSVSGPGESPLPGRPPAAAEKAVALVEFTDIFHPPLA